MIASLILTSALSLALSAQVPAPASQDNRAELALTQSPQSLTLTASGHLALPVFVNGEGPLPFIIDTGASHSAVAESLALALGYVPQPPQRDVQALTERFDADSFTLGELQALGQARSRLDPVIIETPPEAELSAVGLLGADFLRGHTLSLNVANRTATLDTHPVEHVDGYVSDIWGVPFGFARVSDLRGGARVLIDTGSARSIVNRPFAQRLVNQPVPMSTRVGGVSGRLHRDEPAKVVLVRRMRIGGYCRSRVDVLMADLDIFTALGWDQEPAMVIGLDLLSNAHIKIDYASGEVSLDPAPGASNLGCIGQRSDAQARRDSAAG